VCVDGGGEGWQTAGQREGERGGDNGERVKRKRLRLLELLMLRLRGSL